MMINSMVRLLSFKDCEYIAHSLTGTVVLTVR